MEQAAATARSTTAEDFRTLVETHQSRVYSIAVRILQDPGAAEEVAQDVFLALYRNLDAIQCEAHLVNWLRRVTVQRATDACRRRAVRLDFGAEEFLEDGGSAAQAVAQGTRFSALDGILSIGQGSILRWKIWSACCPPHSAPWWCCAIRRT